MLILLLAAGSAGAAVAAWGGVRGGRSAQAGVIAGTVALLLILVAALAMDSTRVGEPGGAPRLASADALFNGGLQPTQYVRLVIALWALESVVVVAIGWLLGGLAAVRGLVAGTLAAIVGGTVAFAATDLVLGSLAAVATGLAAIVVLLGSGRRGGVAVGAGELRTTLVAGTLLLGGLLAAPAAGAIAVAGSGPSAAEASAMVGFVCLAISLGVALRASAIPFHLRVPRLADAALPVSGPLLLAWIPLPLAIVALTAIDQLVAPLALPLDGERALVIGVAALTLCAAAAAALMHDDLRHVFGYLVIADGGLVLLGFAALDPAGWGPTRIWLLVLAASKTALGAWCAVAEERFETRALPDLRGWIRRAPMLAAAFALVIVATYGLPGWIVLGARNDLARLAAGPPWDALLFLAGFLTLPAYLRVLSIGAGPTSSPVARAPAERIAPRQRRAAGPATSPLADGGGAPAADGVGGESRSAGEDGHGESVAPDEDRGSPGGPVASDGPAASGGRGARVSRRGRQVVLRARSGLSRTPPAAGATRDRFRTAVQRDRTELLSAAVLALAILAALTSWGALDIGGAASEPAPVVAGSSAD